MPSSFVDSVPPIVKTIIDVNPERVVDVGPGWGKYGLMCREYLPGLKNLEAVEVLEGRLHTQDVIYDRVYEADVRDMDSIYWNSTDLVLIIDVIEHMTLEDGKKLLNNILSNGAAVIVSTPKVFEEQHDDHNPHEEHVSLWTWQDFGIEGVEITDVSTIDSIIFLLKKRPKVALLVVTDGREYFWDTMDSFSKVLDFGFFDQKIIVDDSLDPHFQKRIKQTYPDFQLHSASGNRRGFGGAIQAGWSQVSKEMDYVFHLEDDFVVTKSFDLNDLIRVLEKHPYLLQVALLRGPANSVEEEAGGIIEQHPDSYSEWTDGKNVWREHRRFFTTNPSLYPRRLLDIGWPDGASSEGVFGIERFNEEPDARSAFWGSFDSGVWIEHIGHIRKGEGY
jgi:hypothetical protein